MEAVKRNRGLLVLPVWGLLLCLLVLAGCSIPEEEVLDRVHRVRFVKREG